VLFDRDLQFRQRRSRSDDDQTGVDPKAPVANGSYPNF
jgi:hypothetical protein